MSRSFDFYATDDDMAKLPDEIAGFPINQPLTLWGLPWVIGGLAVVYASLLLPTAASLLAGLGVALAWLAFNSHARYRSPLGVGHRLGQFVLLFALFQMLLGVGACAAGLALLDRAHLLPAASLGYLLATALALALGRRRWRQRSDRLVAGGADAEDRAWLARSGADSERFELGDPLLAGTGDPAIGRHGWLAGSLAAAVALLARVAGFDLNGIAGMLGLLFSSLMLYASWRLAEDLCRLLTLRRIEARAGRRFVNRRQAEIRALRRGFACARWLCRAEDLVAPAAAGRKRRQHI